MRAKTKWYVEMRTRAKSHVEMRAKTRCNSMPIASLPSRRMTTSLFFEAASSTHRQI